MIKGKEINQEPDNPNKRAKEDSILDVEKNHQIRTPALFENKEDCIGNTNEKTCGSNDSPSETNICEKDLCIEHENEEDEGISENAPEKNDSIKSKIGKGITE